MNKLLLWLINETFFFVFFMVAQATGNQSKHAPAVRYSLLKIKNDKNLFD